ncbi:hypothetical protein HZS_6463 [Henneguya salminicola]|nr:hypothetical protein HZS_6463 [Henneguya salminicola]
MLLFTKRKSQFNLSAKYTFDIFLIINELQLREMVRLPEFHYLFLCSCFYLFPSKYNIKNL